MNSLVTGRAEFRLTGALSVERGAGEGGGKAFGASGASAGATNALPPPSLWGRAVELSGGMNDSEKL